MSNELWKLEEQCGPEYNEDCILSYYHENKSLPWLGYAKGLTNAGWLDDDWSCYQRADVILHQLVMERTDKELQARICLSALINATSFQLKRPNEVQSLNGRDVRFWLRYMVQICQFSLQEDQLLSLYKRLADAPVDASAVDEAYELANQIWAEFQARES